MWYYMISFLIINYQIVQLSSNYEQDISDWKGGVSNEQDRIHESGFRSVKGIG